MEEDLRRYRAVFQEGRSGPVSVTVQRTSSNMGERHGAAHQQQHGRVVDCGATTPAAAGHHSARA